MVVKNYIHKALKRPLKQGPFLLYGWGTRITSGFLPSALRAGVATLPRSASFLTMRSNLGTVLILELLIIKKAPYWDLFYYMAGGQGFEPWLAESESAVLPLDDPPNMENVGRQTCLTKY
jgi:hypothetical protein